MAESNSCRFGAAFRAATFPAPVALILAGIRCGLAPRKTNPVSIFSHIGWQAALGFCFLATGCGDTVKVTNVQPFTNQPPTIVAQGPEYGPDPIDIGRQGAPSPYIIVADPNGISDIAQTFFKIDTAIVRRIIARRDSISPPYCAFVTYNPSDTIDVLPLFQPTFTKVVDCIMSQQRTYFSIAPFSLYPYFASGCGALPQIQTASASFGPPLVGCVSSDLDRIVSFGVYPPAVSSPIEISVTYLEVEYRGISATVYDASGATATARWPNLRLVYTTEKERTVAPVSSTAPRGENIHSGEFAARASFQSRRAGTQSAARPSVVR